MPQLPARLGPVLAALPFVAFGGPGDFIEPELLRDPSKFRRIPLGGRPLAEQRLRRPARQGPDPEEDEDREPDQDRDEQEKPGGGPPPQRRS